MTKEELIRMAREAGCLGPGKGGDPNHLWEPNGQENVTELMFRFATLVAAHEREQCAKVCDEHAKRNYNWASENADIYHAQAHWAARIAKAIRARGTNETK